MSIKKIKYCNGHSEQKEKDGECCQQHEAQVAAEQLTYEHHAQVDPAPKEPNE